MARILRTRTGKPLDVQNGVKAIPVEGSRRLVEIRAHQFENLVPPSQLFGDVRGAVVWYQPPADMTGDECRDVEQRLREAGAVQVKRVSSEAVASDVPASATAENALQYKSVREIVRELVDALPDDVREAASVEVEREISEAGI